MLSIDMIRRQLPLAFKAYCEAFEANDFDRATVLAEEISELKAQEFKIMNPNFANLV